MCLVGGSGFSSFVDLRETMGLGNGIFAEFCPLDQTKFLDWEDGLSSIRKKPN